jgi:diguanylate cyclase (GGDEF)-like protein
VQSALGTTPASRPSASAEAPHVFDRSNVAAIVALARAVELHDPALARRAALRTAVIRHGADALGLDAVDYAAAVGGALVADVASLVTHVRAAGDGEVAASVLAASLLDRVGAGGPVAAAVRHLCERWDGRGAPLALEREAIPRAARVLAVAHALVGPVEAGGTPHWLARIGRVRSLAGTAYDPAVVVALTGAITRTSIAERSIGIDHAIGALETLVATDGDESPIEALTSIGAAIHAAHRLDEVLALIAGHVRRACGAATVGIGRLDTTGQQIHTVTRAGDLAAADGTPETIPLDRFPTTSAYRSDSFHVYVRRELDPGSVEARHLEAFESETELAVPLEVEGHRWGVLWARTPLGGHELGDRELATLRLAATQVGSSIEQATRVAELESLALRDPLTGLGNRRVLDTTLRRIFARPPIARQDCAVIICDVDGLKVVNDTAGHAAGDAVLVDAASALRHAVAEVTGATVCRIGGDEFCIVLDGGGMLHGAPIAAQAQRLFSRSGPNRSMSCGLAVAAIGINAPGELLRAADEAQYLQKRGRRGRLDDTADTTDAAGPDFGGRGGRRARRDR